MRKSSAFLLYCAVTIVLLCSASLHAWYQGKADAQVLKEMRTLVKGLGITDIALFTEARYTRHPSQADLHTAFQDHPFSLEHFPSGSFLPPPERIKKGFLWEPGSKSRETF